MATIYSSAEKFKLTGANWWRKTLSENSLECLSELFSQKPNCPGKRITRASKVSHLIEANGEIGRLAQSILPGSKPVRMTLFDKSEGVNWAVPWHQDRVIAVKERHELEGYSKWTGQNGHWQCEAPVSIFTQSIFLRIHLDPQTEGNGAMKLALGSHRTGKIFAEAAKSSAETCKIDYGQAQRGDVLACHALLLHASAKTMQSTRRRAIRIDYSTADLPSPLKWALEL